jgi:cell division protein FtsL
VGSPARKVQAKREPRGPHLRLVPPATRTGKTRAARQQELTARRNFRMFATLVTVVASLGMVRVYMSVQATEACLAADQLRTEIRNERYEGDLLEVRQSALGSPERIRAIAGKAMGMAPARSVSYLELKSTRRVKSDEPSARAGAGKVGLAKVLSNVMDLTAGEAEVLLVGDVGLSSSR